MPSRHLLAAFLFLTPLVVRAEGPPVVSLIAGDWSGDESKLPQLIEHVVQALEATGKVVVAGTPESRAAQAEMRGGDPCSVDAQCSAAREALQACASQAGGCPDPKEALKAYQRAIAQATKQKPTVGRLRACLADADCKAAMASETRAGYHIRIDAGRIGDLVAVTGSLTSAGNHKVLKRKSVRYEVGERQMKVAAVEVAKGLVEALP